jgi:hypothetical protein
VAGRESFSKPICQGGFSHIAAQDNAIRQTPPTDEVQCQEGKVRTEREGEKQHFITQPE